MAIKSLKSGSYGRSVMAGNSLILPGDYESIATTTIGAGGASSVTFSSIPQTFTHLQVRIFAQNTRSTYNIDDIYLDRINGSTAGNAGTHRIYSQLVSPGTAITVEGYTNYDGAWCIIVPTQNATAYTFGAGIVDILDYTSINKNKTIRSFGGGDTNGFVSSYAGGIGLSSGYATSTNPITTFRLRPVYGTQFNQYSQFALYGIRG